MAQFASLVSEYIVIFPNSQTFFYERVSLNILEILSEMFGQSSNRSQEKDEKEEEENKEEEQEEEEEETTTTTTTTTTKQPNNKIYLLTLSLLCTAENNTREGIYKSISIGHIY